MCHRPHFKIIRNRLTQIGDLNVSTINQSGFDGRATVAQNNASNVSTIKQGGSGNVANVTQTGQ